LLTGAHPFQRRRASEARDFGVVPIRPSGFSRRQWRTLAKGLSWHRAGRTISVADWLKDLKPGSESAPPLKTIGDLKPAPLRVPHSPAVRPSAVFSILVSIAAVSLLFVRMAPGGKVSSEPISAAAISGRTARTTQTGEPAIASAPSLTTTQGVSPSQSIANHGTPVQPGAYQVQPGQHFAEIRVRRPAHARNDAALTWWTEPASAKPGIDYVNQAKVSQSFPKGQDFISVFVKLLPDARRNQPGVFYVAVADKGPGDQHAGQIMHTAVRLPSSRTPL
jgi:hypothetical protein